METTWIIIFVSYVAIGFVFGVIMVAAGTVMSAVDMEDTDKPSNQLFWIPLGIIAWPIFVASALKDWLRDKNNK